MRGVRGSRLPRNGAPDSPLPCTDTIRCSILLHAPEAQTKLTGRQQSVSTYFVHTIPPMVELHGPGRVHNLFFKFCMHVHVHLACTGHVFNTILTLYKNLNSNILLHQYQDNNIRVLWQSTFPRRGLGAGNKTRMISDNCNKYNSSYLFSECLAGLSTTLCPN